MNNHPVLSKRPYEEEVQLKTKDEIMQLSLAGRLVGTILKKLRQAVCAGLSTGSIEKICEKKIEAYSQKWSIKKFPDFPTYLSISVNDTAAHGEPDEYKLHTGDIVTLDLVLDVNGWYGDAAITVPVGAVTPAHAELIRAAEQATLGGIAKARAGGRIGDIGAEIEKIARKSGCAVIENLIGHGIGRDLHEGPAVFSNGELDVGAPIVPGMVFTIEPVLTRGSGKIYAQENGHAYKTEDRKCTAVFEHTVAVLSDKTLILTKP